MNANFATIFWFSNQLFHPCQSPFFSAINLKKVDSRILKLRSLVNLDLSGNAIKDITVFGDAAANKLDSLKELRLSSNQVRVICYLLSQDVAPSIL